MNNVPDTIDNADCCQLLNGMDSATITDIINMRNTQSVQAKKLTGMINDKKQLWLIAKLAYDVRHNNPPILRYD